VLVMKMPFERPIVKFEDQRDTVMLKDCSLCFNPPKKKHIPSTSNKLDNIDPNNEACTIKTFP
jgi:hypothetical protein